MGCWKFPTSSQVGSARGNTIHGEGYPAVEPSLDHQRLRVGKPTYLPPPPEEGAPADHVSAVRSFSMLCRVPIAASSAASWLFRSALINARPAISFSNKSALWLRTAQPAQARGACAPDVALLSHEAQLSQPRGTVAPANALVRHRHVTHGSIVGIP